MKLTPQILLVIVVSLCAIVGCDKTGLEGAIPIRGSVTYKGAPLTTGEVRYMPVDQESGRVARGKLQSDGSFQLTTLKKNDGALPGEYQVVVVVFAEGPSDSESLIEMKQAEQTGKLQREAARSRPPIPARYYNPEKSGLADRVTSEHSGVVEFHLVDSPNG